MSDRIGMSLDDIIAQKHSTSAGKRRQEFSNRSASRNMSPRSQNQGKRQRGANANYEYSSRNDEIFALKILIPQKFAGSFIGNSGSNIKDLIAISGAAIHRSDFEACYPGTNDRVVFIKGTETEVTLAQSLIWELVGQQTEAEARGAVVEWSPKAAKNNPGRYDEIEIEGRITIPANTAGVVLGRGGSNIRSIGEESGIALALDNIEDAAYTNERVITMKGSTAGCMNCTSLILSLVVEDMGPVVYTVNGTGYPKRQFGSSSSVSAHSVVSKREVFVDDQASVRDLLLPEVVTPNGVKMLSANTRIELAVPDHLAGALVGKHVNFYYLVFILSS